MCKHLISTEGGYMVLLVTMTTSVIDILNALNKVLSKWNWWNYDTSIATYKPSVKFPNKSDLTTFIHFEQWEIYHWLNNEAS